MIEAFVSDDNTFKNVKVRTKNNVLRTGEEEDGEKQGRQYFLCDKRHKFRPTGCTTGAMNVSLNIHGSENKKTRQ